MSFILDALRKSEGERQRGALPNVAHAPLAVSRVKLPKWALTVMTALTMSVVLLAAAWWANQRQANTTTPVAADSQVPAITAPSQRQNERATDADERNLAGQRSVRDTRRSATPAAESDTTSTLAAEVTTPGQVAGIPSLAQVRAEGASVPLLTLELHSYSDVPGQRFVFINGARYREGDRLKEGPRLITIRAQGAILNHQNRDFLLLAE